MSMLHCVSYFILFMCSLSIETKNCTIPFTPRKNILQRTSGSSLEMQVFNLKFGKMLPISATFAEN